MPAELTINPVAKDCDLSIIEDLATQIWREHYTPIIGREQVSYMLRKFQSQEAMKLQIAEGMEYFLLTVDQLPIGYFGIQEEDDAIFLSKIYILDSQRGRSYGKKALSFLYQLAGDRGKSRLRLTVNKYNKLSIDAYLKMGFVKTGEVVMDIGEGFVMDDFLMEKAIESQV